MADVDKDVQKMFDEIKHPENNKKWIYESAEINGVHKVFKREFGAEPSTRTLISEHNMRRSQ
tara:strand:- start:410 stop:595 length:186 start_codon:yes stop_codon:yes gene_type:complete